MTRQPLIRLYDDEAIIDGFAGGGGASEGIEMAIGRSPDIAINHDPIALAMHAANHPTTRHVTSNIRHVRYERELPAGKRCGIAWFSPDCTHHSKARGGKPFRDPQRARRTRGLAWEAVRCAKALHASTPPGQPSRAPRLIVLENVEEWRDWCPLKQDGTPDWSRKGENFRRWKRELEKAGPGYTIELQELRACDYGAPTARKRLFVIARSDGRPIVWPEPTHGPGLAHPYRTAAECIDFGLPVPSIFLTKTEAEAWAQAQGLPKSHAPRRPLATATKRRIARGVWRFVVDSADPFIIKYHGERRDGEVRGQRIDVPIKTLDASNRFALITPFLASVRHHDNSHLYRTDEPIRTIPASDREFALVSPLLINTRNGERHGKHGEQAPRVHDIQAPYPTITALGSQGAIVAAFLAKHNAGHEATGQRLGRPLDTVTTKDTKALVTSNLVHLKGSVSNHPNTARDVRQPIPALTAGGNHLAEVRVTLVPRDSIEACHVDRAVQTCAFLVKYFGTGVARPLDQPIGSLTTKDRLGLVMVILVRVGDNEYVLADIGMRMLTPRELFLCQGFPPDYQIDTVNVETPLGIVVRKPLTKKAQTRLVGNSVPPHVAAAIIAANLTGVDLEAVA